MDKFLELKVIITFSIFVFFLIIERLLVYKEYKKKKRLISNFSLWFINGVSSYFKIIVSMDFLNSSNLLGIIPLPYKKGIFSNSI